MPGNCLPRNAALSALLLASSALGSPIAGPLKGRIVDWPAGKTGEIRLTSGVSDNFLQAPVDARGNFSLPLPAGANFVATLDLGPLSEFFAKDSKYFDRTCSGVGAVNPSAAKYRGFSLDIYVNGERLGDVKLASTNRLSERAGDTFAQLLYLDRPATIKGTVTCPDLADRWEGTFAAGWNLVTQVVQKDAASYLITNAAPPKNLAWYLYSEYVGIGIGFNTDSSGQVYATNIYKDSPAERAGVQVGDVIVEVDGRDVSGLTAAQIVPLLRGEAGTKLTLGVRRAGSSDVTRFDLTRALLRAP